MQLTPIVQKQVTCVNVVVGRSGSVDENATKHTLPRLKREVRVVPGASILGRSPFISERLSRCNGALGYGRYAIILVCIVLTDTMKVNTSAVVGKAIRHMDSDSVAPVGNDGRTWERTVDSKTNALDAVGRDSGVRKFKVVLASRLANSC